MKKDNSDSIARLDFYTSWNSKYPDNKNHNKEGEEVIKIDMNKYKTKENWYEPMYTGVMFGLHRYNYQYVYEVASQGYGVHIEVYGIVRGTPEEIKAMEENDEVVYLGALREPMESLAGWYMNDIKDKPDGTRPTIEEALDSWYEDRATEAEGNVSRPLDECDPWEEKEEIKHYNKEGEEVIKIEMPELPEFLFIPEGQAIPKGYSKVDFGKRTAKKNGVAK